MVFLWWLAAAGLLLLVFGSLVAAVWEFVDLVRSYRIAQQAGTDPQRLAILDTLRHTEVGLSAGMIALGVACVAAQIGWIAWNRRVLERAGDRGREHLDHWAIIAGRASAAAFVGAAVRGLVTSPQPGETLAEVADAASVNACFLGVGVLAAVVMAATALVTLRRTAAFLRPVPVA
jgi:hypothetical protein